MAPRDDLEQRYNDLTDRQKAIVEAWAKHPEETNRNIADQFAPQIYNEEYVDSEDDKINEMNESYVSQFSNKDGVDELIQYRQDIVQNQRFEGSATTEGDPFSADPNMQQQAQGGYQTWDERPNKEAAQSTPVREPESADTVSQTDAPQDQLIQLRAPVAARVEDDAVHIMMDKQYFKTLLKGQSLPPELHKQLIDDVLANQLA